MAYEARGQVALITDCSTGIGRATAERLHEAGLTVYATARRLETLEGLATQGIRTLSLDVTDETSMVDAVRQVASEANDIDVLVNNAGYGLYGPVEQLPMEENRRQFETNFFGLVRLTQLVLPGMRAAKRGRILNVSSMGGRITLPGGAFYDASKHAVESLSDALRVEVRPFGIDVVLIEPGPVKARGTTSRSHRLHRPRRTTEDAMGDDDPYAEFKAAVGTAFGAVTTGPTSRLSSMPDDIAKVIAKAVTARQPRTRYLINPVAKGFSSA